MTVTRITANQSLTRIIADQKRMVADKTIRVNPPVIREHLRPYLRQSASQGQASLEMTVALIGGLLLFAGSIRVFMWIAQRLIDRQASYEATRPTTANSPQWSEPANDPTRRLDAVR